MAATFPKFPILPKELRLMIWEEALLGARDTRTVILHSSHRLCPMDHLISPLLSVNKESRACAQAFYHVQLDIYTVPNVETIQNQWYWNPNECYEILEWKIGKVENIGQKKGKVYMSPEQDKLVYGYEAYDCLFHNTEVVGFVSTELPASACEKVCSLILDEPPAQESISKECADDLWQATRYPNLCSHYCLPKGGLSKALLEVIMSGGQLPENLERWVWHRLTPGNGETVLVPEASLMGSRVVPSTWHGSPMKKGMKRRMVTKARDICEDESAPTPFLGGLDQIEPN